MICLSKTKSQFSFPNWVAPQFLSKLVNSIFTFPPSKILIKSEKNDLVREWIKLLLSMDLKMNEEDKTVVLLSLFYEGG